MSVEPTTTESEEVLGHWAAFQLEYVVDTADAGRSHCTMFPRDATPVELLTTWISADERSFVSLDDIR